MLDHIFIFIEPDGPEVESLRRQGLSFGAGRRHPGQGTANACVYFDNAYLELLWQTDAEEIASPLTRPTGLHERADWRRNGACPFGISYRGGDLTGVEMWDYRPTYLPEGMTIPMARDSLDPKQPLIFRSPGNMRPDQWTDGRAGDRQTLTGLREIRSIELTLPEDVAISNALKALQERGWLTTRHGTEYAMTLALTQETGGEVRLTLPNCQLQNRA